MFSRRDVVKLGAAGLIAPSLGLTALPAGSAAQQKRRDVPMFRGNAARTSEMPGPAPDDSNGIEVLWQFETGGQLRTPPSVVDGIAYLGSRDGNLYALSILDGTERWRFQVGEIFESGPAVADGVVCFGSEDGSFHALDASTGEERWRYAAGSFAGSPAVADGIVLATGGSQGDMTLFGLDIQDGTERWRFAYNSSWYQVPAVANDAAFLSTGAALHANNLHSGKEVWRVTAESVGEQVVVADDTIYLTLGEGISAFNAQDGTERWRTSSDIHVGADLAIAEGTMFAGSGVYGTIHALNVDDGSIGWIYTLDGYEPYPAPPSRYAFGSVAVADNTVFATRSFNELYAINAHDGSERWVFHLEASGKNYVTAPVIVDGMILIGCSLESGILYALGGQAPRLAPGATARVTTPTTLRGAPAPSGIARTDVPQGTLVIITGDAVITAGIAWWPVHIASTDQQGWVEGSALEPVANGG